MGGERGGEKVVVQGEVGITCWYSNPSSYLNPSPLYEPHPPYYEYIARLFKQGRYSPFFSSNNCIFAFFYCLAKPQYEEGMWNERQLQCHVSVPFLTSFDFKFEWLSRTNEFLLTSSIVSGSDADASHLLFRMKMFGLEKRWFTLWKKFFSCKWQGYQMRNHTSMGRFNQWMLPHWINFSCNKSHFKATEF